jgi:hypothetical protein
MSSRRVDVFFYGLFMDQALLRQKGLNPRDAELSWVEGLALRIGERAALVPAVGSRVYGITCSLTPAELDRLYSDPGVQAYRPEAILAHLASGPAVPALCYNLPQPPLPAERNPAYAAKLRALGEKVGLPAEYVASLQ